ncbi:Ras-like GTP-binding protein 3F-1 [Artemisia annua]|uniref:Ras-like GTP-binding protein 3F-1 n=1 Tax=Artemisia annua TaxID=35608 RepID=A0A2U1P1I1_ARTAN|nr:Ras-like GTP-binding protein 3F-1 [Artemisia annua]
MLPSLADIVDEEHKKLLAPKSIIEKRKEEREHHLLEMVFMHLHFEISFYILWRWQNQALSRFVRLTTFFSSRENVTKQSLMELAKQEQVRAGQQMEKKRKKLIKAMDHFEREKREKAVPLIEAAFQHRLADERLFMNVSNRWKIPDSPRGSLIPNNGDRDVIQFFDEDGDGEWETGIEMGNTIPDIPRPVGIPSHDPIWVSHLDMGKRKDFGKGKSKKSPKQKSPSMPFIDKTEDPTEEVSSVGTSRPVIEESKVSEENAFWFEVGTLQGWAGGIFQLRTIMINRTGSENVQVKITLDGKETFTLLLRRTDLYLIGFRFRDGTTYEFGKSGKRFLGIHSNFLGYSESYKDLGGLSHVRIGHGALRGAVEAVMSGEGLTKGKDRSAWAFRIASSLATLLVMLIECGRFKWLDPKLKSLMEVKGSNQTIESWMPGLIQDWGTISDTARSGKVCKEAPPAAKLDYDDDDVEKARKYNNWAEDALALLKQSKSDLPHQMAVAYPSFKLLLAGDGATGKTTFLKRHLNGEFKKEYEPTSEVLLQPLDFFTNHGMIRFYCWDLAGKRKHKGEDEGHRYYTDGQCAILMFDFTSKVTYDNIHNWHRDLCSICKNKNIPIVLCGNKSEVKKRAINDKKIQFHKKKNLEYFEISVKHMQNLEMPFLSLARILTGFPDICFLELPALYPPHVMPDMEPYDLEEAFEAAKKQRLPDDGDDFI